MHTDKQTNKQTNAGKNIYLLAEVNNFPFSIIISILTVKTSQTESIKCTMKLNLSYEKLEKYNLYSSTATIKLHDVI